MKVVINMQPSHEKISYKAEVQRKLIHLSSLWMPLAIFLLPERLDVILFALLLASLLFFEFLRHGSHGTARVINRIFASILRHQEIHAGFRLSGATYVLFSALFCSLLFPESVSITSLSILILADTAASLFGRRYGKRAIMGKTVEGSLAFLVTAIITVCAVGQLFPNELHFYPGAIAAAIAATGAELFSGPLHIDDNLFVPLAAASVMSLVIALL